MATDRTNGCRGGTGSEGVDCVIERSLPETMDDTNDGVRNESPEGAI